MAGMESCFHSVSGSCTWTVLLEAGELRACGACSGWSSRLCSLPACAVLIPWSVSSFDFAPLAINGLVASRALCHEESAFCSLLVSGLEKVLFFFLFPEVPKSLIVVGTSPNAFPLGQAAVGLLVAIMSEKKAL